MHWLNEINWLIVIIIAMPTIAVLGLLDWIYKKLHPKPWELMTEDEKFDEISGWNKVNPHWVFPYMVGCLLLPLILLS